MEPSSDSPSPTSSSATSSSATSPSQTVISADWVITVDPDDRVVDDGAVVVTQGRITAVGERAALVAEHPDATHVALGPHALIPGLVNAHTHLGMTMFRGLADDRDLQSFLDRLLPAEAKVVDAARVGVATRAAALESVTGGVTSALDMYYFAEAGIAAAAEVGLRMFGGPVLLDHPGPDGRRIEQAARWLDDRPAGTPLRPMLGPHSTYLASPELLSMVGALRETYDAILHIHASETQHEVDTVRAARARTPVEHLDDLGLLGPFTVLAHGVHLDDDEIARIASTGATVAHCPASNLKLGAGVARVPDLLAAGANVALGTDGAASSNDLDMFAAMRLAALLHKGVAGDPTAMPAHTVLRMATLHGAAALGLSDRLGSIEVGKLADLVAVDLDRAHTRPVYDPISTLVYAAGRGDVRHVWVGGEHIVEDGRSRRVAHEQVVDELEGLADAVLAAAE